MTITYFITSIIAVSATVLVAFFFRKKELFKCNCEEEQKEDNSNSALKVLQDAK